MFRRTSAALAFLLLAAVGAAAQATPGREQSPVDIVSPVANSGLPPLSATYPVQAGVAVNNGHTVQVNVGPGDSLRLGGAVYGLRQFHFHWPSEHLLRGDSFPAEIHMVHVDAAGRYAVLGTWVRQSARDNPAWARFFARIPREGDSVSIARVDIARLFAITALGGERVYRYPGSLTTEPYTEGVQWLVRETPIELSARQLEKLREVMHRYSREVQPLNGREIEYLEP